MSVPATTGITTEESQLVAMLRDKMKEALDSDYFKSDAFLVRWVRAQGGNLDNAEKMIRASLLWRKETNVADILKQPVNEFFSTNFPISIDGVDKAGRPLLQIPFGRWDLAKATMDDIRFDQFKTYVIQINEQLAAACQRTNASRKAGDPLVNQFTAIYDWEGFSFKPLMNIKVDKHLADTVSLIEHNYPDSLCNCIFVNCSSMISTFLAIIKPVMSAKTFSKIQWFGADNKAKGIEAILNLVDPSQLPPVFGGTKAPPPPSSSTGTLATN